MPGLGIRCPDCKSNGGRKCGAEWPSSLWSMYCNFTCHGAITWLPRKPVREARVSVLRLPTPKPVVLHILCINSVLSRALPMTNWTPYSLVDGATIKPRIDFAGHLPFIASRNQTFWLHRTWRDPAIVNTVRNSITSNSPHRRRIFRRTIMTQSAVSLATRRTRHFVAVAGTILACSRHDRDDRILKILELKQVKLSRQK